MADVIKKLGHTVEEVDEHLNSTELHIQEGERDKWNKAADTANTASTTATAAQSEAAINRTTLGVQRKNWLKNTATSQTVNGITFTINDDKSITANGTATAFTSLNIGTNVPITDGDFIYTCTPQGGSEATYRAIIRAYDSNNSAVTETLTETGEGIKITISNGSYINAIIRISSGTTVDNLTFYPMLRCAEITDGTYEPYRDSVDERLKALEELNGDVHIGGYTIKSGESLTLSNISIAVIHFARTGGAESTSKSSMHAVYVAANTSIDHIKTAVNMTIESTAEGEFTITNNSTMTTVGMIFYKLRS